MSQKTEITKADIMPAEDYAKTRREQRRHISEVKKHRRVEVGPYATFYFENFETMWHQVQEMLHIERGGDAQLKDELEAYNPLIPKGSELSATVMFEIDDPLRRANVLGQLGGVENRMYISVGGEKIVGVPDPTRENTSLEGKASAVQFVRFRFSPGQIAQFRTLEAQILVGMDHPRYGHIAVMPEPVRQALSGDFA